MVFPKVLYFLPLRSWPKVICLGMVFFHFVCVNMSCEVESFDYSTCEIGSWLTNAELALIRPRYDLTLACAYTQKWCESKTHIQKYVETGADFWVWGVDL